MACADGTYTEHGREIFDEEVDDTPTSTAKGKGKKKYVSLCSVCMYSARSFNNSFEWAQSAPGRRVAKPSGDIKQMLLSMGEPSKRKKKEVNNCHHSASLLIHVYLQETATVKDDDLLSDLLMEIKVVPRAYKEKRACNSDYSQTL